MDARTLNWRFVVPELPAELVLLPVGDEQLEGATTVRRTLAGLDEGLRAGCRAVVAPDLTGWARELGGLSAAVLLRRLADAVLPGGWLYAGVQTRPLAAGRQRLTLAAATTVLHEAGLADLRTWFPLPTVRCPAFLVPADRSAELDVFLATAFFPYTDSRSALRGRVRQQVLSLGQRAALRSPHSLRLRCAPGLAFVARRPS